MSSHHLTVPARRRGRLPRLDLVRLEDRTVPTTIDFGPAGRNDDPALDPIGAGRRLAQAFGSLAAFDEPNTVSLFPGGVYVFDNTNTTGSSALGAVNPTSSQKSATATFLTVNGNGATLLRTAKTPDPVNPGKMVATNQFNFLTLAGDANGYGVARINDLTFQGGSIQGSGGAVAVGGVPVVFTGDTFRNNTANGSPSGNANGGAVVFGNTAIVPWTSRFDGCVFEGNQAARDGGAVALSDGGGSQGVENLYTYVFTQCQIEGNKAGLNGGGIAARDDDFSISGSSLVTNTAGSFGGGLFDLADIYRTNSTTGGGLDFGNSLGYVTNTTVDGNTAAAGGGVYVTSGWNDLRFYNSTITDNTATGTDAKGVAGAGGLHREVPGQSPDDFFVTARRPGNTYVRVELAFSVVADNTATTAAAADMVGRFFDPTPVTNDTYTVPNAFGYGTNFVGNPSGITGGDVNRSLNGSPVLGPLQDNGGGLSTRVPQPGSALLDAGRPTLYPQLLADPNTAATTDERGGGYTRIAFGVTAKRLDIGAVEVQAPGSVALIKAGGDHQTVAIRAAFDQPLRVRTLDRFGGPLAGQTVGAAVIPAGPGATFPLGSVALTDAAGFAVLYPVANKSTGSYDQLVSIGQNVATFRLTNRTRLNFLDPAYQYAGVDANGFPTVFDANDQPVTIDVSGSGQTKVVNTVYGTDLKVLVTRQKFTPTGLPVLDAKGNPTYAGVPGVTVSFLVASADGDTKNNPAVVFTTGAVAANGNYATVTTDAGGYAAVTAKANTKVGGLSVLVSTAGATPGSIIPLASGAVSFFLENLAGPTTKLTFVQVGGVPDPAASGNGQSALVPNLFDSQLAVLAGDDFGNPARDQVVTFATDPANPAQARFPNGPTAKTDAQGIARVTAGAGAKAGTYAVTATAAGLAPQVFALTNLPGLPAGVSVAGGDGQSAPVTDTAVASGTAGAFAQPLTVEVRDAGGNPVPNANVSFQGPGIGAGARFVPVAANTDAAGRASVAVVPNSASGRYTVTVSVQTGNGTFATTTFTLTNTPGAPAAVDVVSGGGQSAQAGSPFGQPIVVRVLDRFQNPVPGVTPVVTSGGATFTAGSTGADGLSQVLATAGGTAGSLAGTARVGALTVTFPLTVTGLPPGPPVPPVGPPTLTAVGLDGGIASRVTVYNADGSVRTQFAPFDPGFLGGSRVAVARVPGPAAPTVVVVPGPGRFPDAQVFSADTGDVLSTFQPFEQTFTGGVFVAAADVDRDGWEDYVFSPDQGGGPRVQIRSGKTGAVLQDFFGIDDPNFRGGARTAVADVNGDKVPDLIVAAGFGGGPRIAVYDGKSLIGLRATPVKLMGDFFAFEQGLRNGAYVAAGDVTGDGVADVVLGGGPGGGPRVRVLNGAELVAGRQTVVSDFFAGPSSDRGGIKVAVREVDETPGSAGAKGDIVTASGTGDGSRVSVYLGKDLRVGQPVAARGFDDLAGFRGGVFVG